MSATLFNGMFVLMYNKNIKIETCYSKKVCMQRANESANTVFH